MPAQDVADLKSRLTRTRRPRQLPAPDWTAGVPVGYLRTLAERWRTTYDWYAWQAALNSYPQFRTTIDDQQLHFLHVRSAHQDALPLLVTHGWPSSIAELLDVVGPLTDPTAHGGDERDAFHVVAPSVPGHGFSVPLSSEGWNARRSHRWSPTPCTDREFAALTLEDQSRLTTARRWSGEHSGYAHLQSTAPQTLAFAMADSPAGRLAWITEKYRDWTDPAAALPEDAVSLDHLLTTISVYWFTNTAATSANLYRENRLATPAPRRSAVPTAVAVFPTDIAIRAFFRPLRRTSDRLRRRG